MHNFFITSDFITQTATLTTWVTSKSSFRRFNSLTGVRTQVRTESICLCRSSLNLTYRCNKHATWHGVNLWKHLQIWLWLLPLLSVYILISKSLLSNPRHSVNRSRVPPHFHCWSEHSLTAAKFPNLKCLFSQNIIATILSQTLAVQMWMLSQIHRTIKVYIDEFLPQIFLIITKQPRLQQEALAVFTSVVKEIRT